MDKQRRSTKSKQLVMNVLNASSTALCHEDIEKQLPQQVDRVTIYRILQGFCDEGKVHKILNEAGKTFYALCRECTQEEHHDNHPHFHCIACDTITCMETPAIEQPLPAGYSAVSETTFISGYCNKCNVLKTLCLLALLFANGIFAFAQKDSIMHELTEIVVVDNNSRLQGETVMSVERLSLKSPVVQGVSLSEKLSSVAGIDYLSTGAGIGKPVIRGLSGNRIAVFSQGIRIENQQWGDEHGLGLDENGLERVEIIKGPASLLYGSDALGGVLYFVGERYAQANSVEGTVNSEFSGNSLGFKNNGTFKLSKNRFHWNLFGGYVTHADYADGNGYFVPNSRFNTSNLKTGLGYTGEKYNTSLKYSYLNEKYGLTETDESEGEAYQNGRTPALPFQDLNTHIISSENTYFFENDSKLKIDAGYVFNNRKEFEDADEAALNMNLHTVSYNAGWYSPMWNERWTLTAGSQGMAQINVDRGEEILIPDAQTTDFGLFAVSNFHYSQKAYWQAGIRFDTRHISSESFENQYHSFNFSTGIYQPVMENLSFRINLSSGFRAPNMYELLTDGIHHGTNRYETGNRDLKTENSYQIDASLNYKSLHFELFANPYFNYILNYIGLNPSNEMIDNLPVFNYIQQDACLYGGEAGFHFHPHPLDWLHIEGAYSNTFGQNKQHNPLALTPSQKLNMMISASLKLKKAVEKISIYVQNKYSFAQNRVAAAETATPAYNLLNAGFSIETKYLIANLAINNVLNKVYYDHLSRYKIDGIYNAGRNFNVKITIPFSANL